MFGIFKRMSKSEKGLGTVEIIIIIAVLVGIALIFREAIIKFVSDIIKSVFSEDLTDKLNTNQYIE